MKKDFETQIGTPLETSDDLAAEFEALRTVVGALQPLDAEARERILGSVVTFLKIARSKEVPSPSPRLDRPALTSSSSYPAFSDDTAMSAKEFLLEKEPRSLTERVACLAYFLTHYREEPHFKTADISQLNTEAAQARFSNATSSVDNAAQRGLLVQAGKGRKQLSASGERFVDALPDREAADAVRKKIRDSRTGKRKRKNSKPKKKAS